MSRGLFNLLASMSLVACACLTVLWAHSETRDFRVPWDALAPGRAGWRAESTQGSLFVRRIAPAAPVTQATRPPRGFMEVPENGGGYVGGGGEFLGGLFTTGEWALHRNGTAVLYREYRVRYGVAWLIAAPFGVAAGLRARRLYHERKLTRRGLCRHCGYDLRATPGRCPECGKRAATTA